MPEAIPSLEELTQAVFALRQELTGQITEALVAQRHGPTAPPAHPAVSPLSASPACPTCAAAHGAHDGRRSLPVPSLLLLH